MTDDSSTRLRVNEGDDSTTSDDRRCAGEDEAGHRTSWAPETLEGLHGMLYAVDLGSPNLEASLKTLENQHGGSVYSELIYLLCHLRFEKDEARLHWRQILAHRESMQERLGAPLDMRVALISYFLEVSRKFENPTIIEMQLFERTRVSAYRDELTGLYNYRMLREHLGREITRSERSSTPMSLVMIDLDNFKRYNDQHGHEAGNQALAEVAGLLNASLRQADIAARYGGEEFVLILSATTKQEARDVAERARQSIEEHRFTMADGMPEARLTVSMGVATFPADGRDVVELVRNADRAMYAAKASGKNHVSLFGRSRRSFGRMRACLHGSYRLLAPERQALSTVNISEAGMLLVTPREVSEGSIIEVELPLPEPYGSVIALGQVIHVEATRSGEYRAAVQITDANNDARNKLMRYIRELSAQTSPEPESCPEPPAAARS